MTHGHRQLEAATKVQALARRRIARQRVQAMRDEKSLHEARQVAEHVCQNRTRLNYRHVHMQTKAATKVQSVARSRIARAKVQEMREDKQREEERQVGMKSMDLLRVKTACDAYTHIYTRRAV